MTNKFISLDEKSEDVSKYSDNFIMSAVVDTARIALVRSADDEDNFSSLPIVEVSSVLAISNDTMRGRIAPKTMYASMYKFNKCSWQLIDVSTGHYMHDE